MNIPSSKQDLIERLRQRQFQWRNQSEPSVSVPSSDLSVPETSTLQTYPLKSEELFLKEEGPSQSEVQRYILAKLEENKFWFDSVLKNVIDIAQAWTAPNPVTGEIEESDKLRLDATKVLLEMTGAYKSKRELNISFSFARSVYGDR